MPVPLKVVVSGGFGVGKTTLVGAVSEIEPLRTEEVLTEVSVGIDDLDGVGAKTTTTVAMDFGRRTFDDPSDPITLYLFGTPGQHRFWFMWDELIYGAVGAVVLVDTRRLADCFAAVGYFEQTGLPFIIAINRFDGAGRYTTGEVRDALELPDEVPIVECDARDTASAVAALITLVSHALHHSRHHSPALGARS